MSDYDDFIAHAMEQGWVEPVFYDDEVMMKIVPGEDNPVWQEHIKEVDADILALVEKGIIEASGLDEHGEIVYSVTEYGRKVIDGDENI